MNRTRATVADIRAAKGHRQLTMVYVTTPDEAAACAEAGIDLLSIEMSYWDAEMRAAAGDWIKITLHNCFNIEATEPHSPFTQSTAAEPVVYGPPQVQIIDANRPKIQLFNSQQVGLHAQLLSYDIPTEANGVDPIRPIV